MGNELETRTGFCEITHLPVSFFVSNDRVVEQKVLQNVKVIAFDMYGTLVNPGALSEAVKQVVPERVDADAFNHLWRGKSR